MEDKFKEVQRKIDKVPAKSPLQESIKEALQGILECVKMVASPVYVVKNFDPDDNLKDSKPGKIVRVKKSKTPVIPPHNVPKQTTGDLGPDPRDREAKADLNFNLDE